MYTCTIIYTCIAVFLGVKSLLWVVGNTEPVISTEILQLVTELYILFFANRTDCSKWPLLSVLSVQISLFCVEKSHERESDLAPYI